MLELTNLCNLACTTCAREYDYGKQMDVGSMPLEKAKAIIDQLWPYLDSLGLTGLGETLLYKDIEKLVDYIKSKNKGIIISGSTNGVVPNFITLVKPLIGKIDTIQISMDGTGEVYNAIRKKGDFVTLDRNLRELIKMCKGTTTTPMLNMVVTKESYVEMAVMVKYAKDVGIDYLDFNIFNLASVTGIDKSYYSLFKTQEFLNAVKALDEESKNNPSVLVTKNTFTRDMGFSSCPFPWTHFYITWNGFVAPCCAKPFPKIKNFGNVFEHKIMDVLNCENYQAFRKLSQSNIMPSFCEKCHFIY
jgi:radical SAM protein with 4Fe4S-binding SPASM domain